MEKSKELDEKLFSLAAEMGLISMDASKEEEGSKEAQSSRRNSNLGTKLKTYSQLT
jgi:hypothetical protein